MPAPEIAILTAPAFRQLVAESADAMFIVRPTNDTILYVNRAMVSLLGYADASELVGRASLQVIVFRTDAVLVRQLAETPREEGRNVHVQWRRRSGEPVAVIGHSSLIEFEGGPAVLVAARRDSELRALAQAEERSRLLFELAPVPIVVIDRATYAYLAVNQAAADMYGWTRDEMLDMKLTDIKEPVEHIPTAISSLQLGGKHHYGLRRHRNKAGAMIEIDITTLGIEFNGRPALMSICLDVTEANRLESQLRQAQKMEAVGQLAGGVAHDFNNLLGVILANVELAVEGVTEQRPIDEELDEIGGAAESAAALTSQLLAFSRKSPSKRTTVAIDAVVTKCEKMLSRVVGEHIEMSLITSPDLQAINANAGQIEQILVNLVVNARDAMPAGGIVILEASNVELNQARAASLGLPAGAYVELSVLDTGVGMDARTRARIFEPFFTTKAVGKGTGLGLSTVFAIVEQGGGAIVVDSEPGHGTTFRIFFPAVAGSVAAPTEAPIVERARGTERVLLVEDDPRLRNVIERHLKALGYTTQCAPQGLAALEMLRDPANRYDLLLTDVVMPGLDGRSLAVQAMREQPELRVVFMSGYTEHSAVKTSRLDNEHFVEKPFTSAKLSHAIRRALQP